MNRNHTPMPRYRHLAELAVSALVALLSTGSSVSAQENPARDAAYYTLGQVSSVDRQAGTLSISGVQYRITRNASVRGPGDEGREPAIPWHRIQPGSYVTYSARDGRIQSIRLEDAGQIDVPPGPPAIQMR